MRKELLVIILGYCQLLIGLAFDSDYEIQPVVELHQRTSEVAVIHDRVLWRTFTAHVARVPARAFEVFPPVTGCRNASLENPLVTAAHYAPPIQQGSGGYQRSTACSLVTNAGFYNPEENSTHSCIGTLVSNYQWKSGTSARVATFALDHSNRIFVGYLNSSMLSSHHRRSQFSSYSTEWRTVVSGLVWLVRNGQNFVNDAMSLEDFKVQTTGNPTKFRNILAPRLGLGHDVLGRVVVVAVDGEEYMGEGLSLDSFADLMVSLGVVNGINLDGGGSVSFFVNDTLVSTPAGDCFALTVPKVRPRCPRKVASVICVRELPISKTISKSVSETPNLLVEKKPANVSDLESIPQKKVHLSPKIALTICCSVFVASLGLVIGQLKERKASQ